jgi:hypothetical protein
MNIFYTSPCPIECAKALDDKRVIKMTLETAQLLSTALSHYDILTTYKPTHRNHPCAIWTRASRQNYMWTYDHFIALLNEYEHRFYKTHACSRLTNELLACPIQYSDLTPHANCTPFKNMPTIEAYRTTLIDKWYLDKRSPKWTRSTRPAWADC